MRFIVRKIAVLLKRHFRKSTKVLIQVRGAVLRKLDNLAKN